MSWVAQLEDVRRGREAPSFVISGTYVVARRRHGPMMLTLFRVVAQADPRKYAGSLPSEDLLCFLEHPAGGDTLNISGCFDIHDQWLWLRMLHFRHMLYTTSASRFGWAYLLIQGGTKAARFLARRLRPSLSATLLGEDKTNRSA